MSKFTKEMVDDYANKLLIGLSEEENKLVLSEFDIIDENMELISNMKDIEKIKPMNYALDDFYCTPNNDEIEETPSINELLQNCDDYEDREVKVPRVVGGSE